MFHFMNFVRPFVNYAIFHELCDRMRFEVDCANSHHQVISEGLNRPFCRYGGHFDFYCFERHYGMLRGQINMYLPPGHPIIAI